MNYFLHLRLYCVHVQFPTLKQVHYDKTEKEEEEEEEKEEEEEGI